MPKKTNAIPPQPPGAVALDAIDRKLLRALAEDATLSYAELGQLIGLSPPAAHERVKRLKREGVITGIVARIDGTRIGCPLLTFVHVETEGWGLTEPVLQLRELADVEEIHTITGKASLILKVRTRDTQSLQDLLARIYAIEGVRATSSYVALSSYLERGPRPEEG